MADRGLASTLTAAGLAVSYEMVSGTRWVAMDAISLPLDAADISRVSAALGRRGKVIVLFTATDLLSVLSVFEGSGLVAKRLGLLFSSGSAQQATEAVIIAKHAKPGGLIVHALRDERVPHEP